MLVYLLFSYLNLHVRLYLRLLKCHKGARWSKMLPPFSPIAPGIGEFLSLYTEH